MPDEVITSLDQVTTAWLTDVLRRSGALDQGAVAAFDMDTRQRELSANAKLKVQYTVESQGDRPQRLFLKLVNIDMEDEFFGPSEVNYYARDYVGLQGAPILRSYDAAFSEAKQRYHVLMDDVSETHVEAFARAPTLEYRLALAEGLAVIHARWWGTKQLAEAGEALPSAEKIKRFVDIAQPGAGHIIKHCSNELKAHWPDAILALYARHPQAMIERTQDGNGFTLIHGDVNHNNILVARDGDRPIYIIDRQPFDWSLTIWLGVYDLAYAIVLEWEVETRRRLEEPILRYYHDQLIRNGVHNYSWEQLFADYKLSAAMCVYVTTEWCRNRLNEQTRLIWLPMLQKTMTAFDDLECAKR
jgi:thiamine kinase-like enzyme